VDKEQIEFLKKEGRPDVWDRIHQTYARMNRRQSMVKSLPALIVEPSGRRVQFEFADYDSQIIESKKNAAEFLYASAVKKLNKNDRFSAREAYSELLEVKGYYPNYKDVDNLINNAAASGKSYILFQMENATRIPLPPDFEKEMMRISLHEINRQWLQFDTEEVSGTPYDFNVNLKLNVIDVSPEAIREKNEVVKKEVEDGWEYQLDQKGNVMKDTLGNDIKLPKVKIISCEIIETSQVKDATIRGRLEFINIATGQIIKTLPVNADSHFQHHSVRANGDLNALDKVTKKRLGAPPVMFPPDFEMILMCAEALKADTKRVISLNKRLLD
jgi:hypothetical protein